MTPEEMLKEAVRQAPSLAVLAWLVVKLAGVFLKVTKALNRNSRMMGRTGSVLGRTVKVLERVERLVEGRPDLRVAPEPDGEDLPARPRVIGFVPGGQEPPKGA